MKKQMTWCFAMATIVGLAIGALLSHGAPPTDFDPGGVTAPPANSINIDTEKSDSADLSKITRDIFIGTGGDIVVVYAGDASQRTLKNLPSGERLPIRARRVLSTGTTATNLVGEY